MTKKQLEMILDGLITSNVFCSEADFQLALVMELKAKFGNVRCEFTPGLYNPDMHIDIAVFDKGALISIELKYKTKGCSRFIE